MTHYQWIVVEELYGTRYKSAPFPQLMWEVVVFTACVVFLFNGQHRLTVLSLPTMRKGTMQCQLNCLHWHVIGSTDYLADQGLDTRNTVNKTMPCWLLPNLTGSTCFESLFLFRCYLIFTECCMLFPTTRNSDFQLAKDKKLSPNQLRFTWMSLNYVKTWRH